MKWGVFDRRTCFDRTLHVAPCEEGGMIAVGHRIFLCECQPRAEQYGEFTLFTHRSES